MDDKLTLRQGLEQFHANYQDQLSHEKRGLSSAAQAFFRSHDIAHVLFGCDISLYGEGTVKIWTIFGTSLGFWQHLKEYQVVNAFELAKNFGFRQLLTNLLKLLFSIPVIILRAKRMNRRWPWANFDAYLDTPIAEIREEFNIRILT